MFKVTNTNSKLGAIYQINLPAIKTCRENAPCAKLCYANKGNYKYKNVAGCYENNLQTFLADPIQAEQDILSQLPLMGHCRIHSSGDIVNKRYFEMLIRIAEQAPKVKFMCFTKKYELVNDYVSGGWEIPENLKIIFSLWDGLECPNPFDFPTAGVILKTGSNELIKENAYPCSGRCDQCFICWKMEDGEQVVFKQH